MLTCHEFALEPRRDRLCVNALRREDQYLLALCVQVARELDSALDLELLRDAEQLL